MARSYAKGALQFIVPALMASLTKQDEYNDEDDWNPCKAAGVCLMLLATCCEDDMVPHVLPFGREWRYLSRYINISIYRGFLGISLYICCISKGSLGILTMLLY